MLLDQRNWRPHRLWFFFTVLATALASGWYFGAGRGQAAWPGGSSPVGFTFGILGGLICLFEFLLWWRKKVRAWRIGRVQVWMRAHIWLGLLCVPLLIYHSGFRFGGPLSAVLLSLVLLVVASGVFGLVLQQYLPRRMLDDVPSETIYSQMDYVVKQMGREADKLVQATCGPPPGEEPAAQDLEATVMGTTHLVVGAIRSAGRVQGKVMESRAQTAPVPGSEPLRRFFLKEVLPYLRGGPRSGSALRFPGRATVMFEDLRVRLDPAAHAAVATLESLCEQRRQLDVQARLHFWLHSWLWIHLPLSVALIVLLFVHIFVALKFW